MFRAWSGPAWDPSIAFHCHILPRCQICQICQISKEFMSISVFLWGTMLQGTWVSYSWDLWIHTPRAVRIILAVLMDEGIESTRKDLSMGQQWQRRVGIVLTSKVSGAVYLQTQAPKGISATLMEGIQDYSSANNEPTLPEVFRMDLCDYFRILAWSFLQRGAALHFAPWN